LEVDITFRGYVLKRKVGLRFGSTPSISDEMIRPKPWLKA